VVARVSVARAWAALRPVAALLALAAIIVMVAKVVLAASSGPSLLVPRSGDSFPAWVAGPLHGLVTPLSEPFDTLYRRFSLLVVLMLVAYVVAIVTVRALDARIVLGSIVVLHALLLLCPPLQLTDLFNYLGYARLGALHGLNPYTHVVAQASLDPVYGFTTWHHLTSPYGPLFTAVSYPLALLPLPVAYWILKLATVLAGLGLIGLVWACARAVGRDPRTAVVFVGLNPVYLIWALGGFHNDFFMVDAALGAVALVLHRRERAAGAALAIAIAIKFTAVLLLPFLLLAVAPVRRMRALLAGLAVAAVPLVALSLALFGTSLPNLQTQSTLLTAYSLPNLFGDVIGAGGGAPWLLHAADAAVVLVVLWLLTRARDWLSGAGWATFALIVSLAWLVPWYLLWLLPLAAIGSSRRLRAATLVMSLFLVVAFVPWTKWTLNLHGVNTLSGPAGAASFQRQVGLER
jgi:hypothetical protein